MRKFTFAVLTAFAMLSWEGFSSAEGDSATDLFVVVNKANPAATLTQEELRPVFQTTKAQWSDGVKTDPVNLYDDDPARQAFDQAVLGLDPDRVARYWIDRKIRGGERPPRKVPSSGAAARVVASERGAVGYVHRGDLNPALKVVAKITNGKVVAP